jgi:hypothetical protein
MLRWNVVGCVMFKTHWKSFIGFVILMMALSIIIVQYGVDAQFRGYPLPFLSIHSIGYGTSVRWHIPNFLLSLGVSVTASTVALAVSGLRVAARDWLVAGLGVTLVIGAAVFFLWHSVESPFTGADAFEHAASVSTLMRHLMATGTLVSAVCFFVFFLKASSAKRPVEQLSYRERPR